MGWRTVVVNKNCKLSYKNDYLVIRSENLQMIHLSEINIIMIENGMVSITSYLINELINNKIKLIFCDEAHNPAGEIVPYYSSFNTSKKVQNQIKWKDEAKEVASKGYITQIGINHKSEFNQFNLTCDLMEPFRPLIDEIVYNSTNSEFDKKQKYKLINFLNNVIEINNKEQFVSNAIPIYIQSVFDALENNKESKVLNYEI